MRVNPEGKSQKIRQEKINNKEAIVSNLNLDSEQTGNTNRVAKSNTENNESQLNQEKYNKSVQIIKNQKEDINNADLVEKSFTEFTENSVEQVKQNKAEHTKTLKNNLESKTNKIKKDYSLAEANDKVQENFMKVGKTGEENFKKLDVESSNNKKTQKSLESLINENELKNKPANMEKQVKNIISNTSVNSELIMEKKQNNLSNNLLKAQFIKKELNNGEIKTTNSRILENVKQEITDKTDYKNIKENINVNNKKLSKEKIAGTTDTNRKNNKNSINKNNINNNDSNEIKSKTKLGNITRDKNVNNNDKYSINKSINEENTVNKNISNKKTEETNNINKIKYINNKKK